ncbi:general secretion pathway protein GspK [Opitutus terrae]|uniref:general secretion pathway protein GspK n=1 Tax=Opitutus terrae TaxID=107709 RepID=UPI001ED90F3A|nr:type II secretion system protein GspK [Opitutus terrae]
MLVIVLVTVLFAATALIAFTEKAEDDLLVEAREIASNRLRREAYSALEVTLAVLEDFRLVNGGWRSPAEGWGDPLEFAGWAPRDGLQVEIAFEDESGKLSLPHVEAATLVNLFEEWGLTKGDAENLTDALLEWMRKDHVATRARTSDYERAELPYGPPQRSLRSFSELAAIEVVRETFFDETGRPNELWHRFVATMSLLDFKQTNLNGAAGDAVLALGSLDRFQQQQLNDYLHGTGDRAQQGPGFFQTTADAAGILGVPSLPNGYGTEIAALRIRLTVREGGTAFQLSAVVAPPGGAKFVPPMADPATSSETGSSTGDKTASAAGTTETAADSKKLNYPFTLLEITENAEFSRVPAPEPKA